MIWGWENPWFFLLAGAAGVLLLIYWLKNKGRHFLSSTLFLWEERSSSQPSCRRLFLRKLPLEFFLETGAILLLACGGAGLRIAESARFPEAVVILNNSCSMTGENRARGGKMVKEYLKRFPGRRVVWLLGGEDLQLLGRSRRPFPFEKYWKGDETVFDAAKALTRAGELSRDSEIILVTDRRPENFDPREMTLLACGRAGENFAIVNAGIKGERVLLEIQSFSPEDREVVLRLNGADAERFLIRSDERKVFNFQLKDPPPLLRFEIFSPFDQLEADNKATLVYRKKTPVRYGFMTLPGRIRSALEQVLKSDPGFQYAPEKAELLFSDASGKKGDFNGVALFFHRGKENAHLERFPAFVDTQEPLLAGLNSTNLVWAFYPRLPLPGQGRIFSFSGPLMSVEKGSKGAKVHFNLAFEHSNMANLPFWPAFFCNLNEYCRRFRQGALNVNYRTGELIVFNTQSHVKQLSFKSREHSGSVPVTGGKAVFQLKKAGVYTLDDGVRGQTVAVTAQEMACSDLRGSLTGTSYMDLTLKKKEKTFRDLSFIFIAAALLLLLWDQYVHFRRNA